MNILDRIEYWSCGIMDDCTDIGYIVLPLKLIGTDRAYILECLLWDIKIMRFDIEYWNDAIAETDISNFRREILQSELHYKILQKDAYIKLFNDNKYFWMGAK